MSERIPCGLSAWMAEPPTQYEQRIASELQIGPATEKELRLIMCLGGNDKQRFDAALGAMMSKGKIRVRPTFTPRGRLDQPLDVLELVA